MNRIKIVKEPWMPMYRDPLELDSGDIVVVTKKKVEIDPEWAGWFWCESKGKEGWIPERILIPLDPDAKQCEAISGYSSKELDVRGGEVVGIEHEMNGWAWCRNIGTDKEGWLPLNILQDRD